MRTTRQPIRRRAVAALTAVLALLGLVTVAGLSAAPAAAAPGGTLGAVTGFAVSGDTATFESGTARVRVIFYDQDVFRIWLAPDGEFTDPNADPADPDGPSADMVIKHDYPGVQPRVTETPSGYRLATKDVVVVAGKDPLTFAAYRTDGTLLFAETSPLSWGADGTTQTVTHQPGEQYFGGGEQNGTFVHTGQTISVARDYNWNEGGAPNSQPFYLSTAGYGVFRDTFQPGTYAFTDPVRTTEQEQRFDGYYFVGSPKQVIGDYTALVGRPFLPPAYGLEMGDSDCYLHNANRGERHTLDAIKVADGYVSRNIPLGWMLVNDGYGCGYEDLQQVGDQLRARNMELGLWTSTGLPNQAAEVQAGVRVRKLDVGWVGPGYRFALDAGQTAYDGIENNSDARGYVWQPVSWAGSQRTSVLWSGDQSGSWDYIRWQIPTYAGATMSGIAYDTGDVDGIFGGSAKTYTRDLEWKSFLPAAMTMDGWAPSDKQPWRYGEPYTSINRSYMQLRERLLPYFYTYAHAAHETGVGQVRPLALEYPDDPATYTDKVKYEFLSGRDFLVAPVYQDSTQRDGIYLPRGTWIDYWTGRTYQGPRTINGYQAPLDRLPLFVRAGAIVPMWAKGTTDWADRDTGRLGLDVYPQGRNAFTLYEDDGHTRAYQDGASATQRFTVTAPRHGRGTVRITAGPSVGHYAGQPAARSYRIAVHTGSAPAVVQRDGAGPLTRFRDRADWQAAASGWYYDPADRGGTVHVKTGNVSARSGFAVTLRRTTAVGGIRPDTSAVQLDVPGRLGPGSSTTVAATFRNGTGRPVRDVRFGVDAPAGVTVRPTGASAVGTVGAGDSARATFRLSVGGQPPTAYHITAHATYRQGRTVRQVSDPAPVQTLDPTLDLAVGQSAFEPEQSAQVTATFTNPATVPAIDSVQLDLAAPDGWTVQPSGDDTVADVRAGDTVQRSWQVTAPNGLSSGQLTATAAWSTQDGAVTGTLTAARQVLTLPTPGQAVLALDAGTPSSAVADGYRRLAPDSAWDPAAGYGWVGTAPQSRDRGAPDDLRRDIVEAPAAQDGTLRLALPAGRHTLYLLVGDEDYAAKSTEVTVDGQRLIAQEDDLAPGDFQWFTGTLDGGATGRTVDLTFSASEDWWKFCALLVGPAEQS